MPPRRYNRINAFRPRGAAADVARAFYGADRPKKPRNKGGRRGRKLGTKVRYNAYQTSRYQSIWLRTERARRLAPPTQLSAGVWQFRSKRKRVKPYRTTTADGSLTPITDFTGTVTRSGNPPDCPLPATNYGFLSPLLKWTANGIHDCSKDTPGSGGMTGGDGGSSMNPPPADWFPVPPGQARTLTVTISTTATITSYSDSCGSDSDTTSGSNTFDVFLNSDSVIRVSTATATGDEVQGDCLGNVSGTFTDTSTILFISGHSVILLARAHDFVGNPLTGVSVHNTETVSATATFDFDIAPLPPPAGYTPLSDTGFELPPSDGSGYTPPSMMSNLATAGGTWQSNQFQVPERLDIFTSIAYSIVSGMPPPSGAIALQLFTDGTMTTELLETPTHAGSGSLNRPMTLLPSHDYYFKALIPETIYCDAAIFRLGGKFLCNCPDFNRRSKAFPSKYPSELGDRDWSGSGAGTRHDCKHIIYLKLQTGEPIDAEANDLKDIQQWRKDQTARQKATRKRERQAEAQGRRDARKRVKADLRGIRQRDKAELKALTANREYKKPKAQRFQRDIGDTSY